MISSSIFNMNFRNDKYSKLSQYHNTKISKLLALIEKLSFVAISNTNMQKFLLKMMNEQRMKLLINQITIWHANHPAIIFKILLNMLQFENTMNIANHKGLCEAFDNIFKDLKMELPTDHLNKFKISFEENSFLDFWYKLYAKTKPTSRQKIIPRSDQLNFVLTRFFKDIMRWQISSECTKLKFLIEQKLDFFLRNMSEFSIHETELLLSLLEGGEFLCFRPGAHAKSEHDKKLIIVNMTLNWFDLEDPMVTENNEVSIPWYMKELINWEQLCLVINYDSLMSSRKEFFLIEPRKVQLVENIDGNFNEFLLKDNRLLTIASKINELNNWSQTQSQILNILSKHFEMKREETEKLLEKQLLHKMVRIILVIKVTF
jgi:hypothetical protein